MINRTITVFLLLTLLLCCAACASIPYQRLDQSALILSSPTTRQGEPQFEYGTPNVVLDYIGWVFGLPAKIILWDRRMDNHRVGEDPPAALKEYLDDNGLSDVKVRINQYAPFREFGRLVRNKSVGWGWRYTIGILVWLYETVLPGRILGGDCYNPYTDTINIYSDAPAVSVHEGGHAKDLAGRKLKGTYAFAYVLPVFALYPESRATNDAVSYLKANGTADEEKEGYRLLCPAMGTYVGGMFGDGPLSPLYYVGVIPGHIIGRVKAARVDRERERRLAEEASARLPEAAPAPPADTPPDSAP